jgi:hypothetical protein
MLSADRPVYPATPVHSRELAFRYFLSTSGLIPLKRTEKPYLLVLCNIYKWALYSMKKKFL